MATECILGRDYRHGITACGITTTSLMAAAIAPSSSSTSSSTKSRGIFSNSDIKRQATREAKAYENYKKDPNITCGSYYQSQKKMTKLMQQHATGK